MEGLVHSVVGATGALYAIRRSLYRPLPEDLVLDDVAVPMAAVLAGRRVVFEEGALAFDRLQSDIGAEYRRKVRTLAGNFQLMSLMPELLDPRKNPIFLQFVSHKAGRLVVPYLLLLAIVSSLFLEGGLGAAVLVGEAAFALCCAFGFLVSRVSVLRRARAGGGLVSLPLRGFLFFWTFLAMNGAAVAGLYYFLAARSDLAGKLWSVKRRRRSAERASEWV
jgi:hypothetical protein